MKKWIVLASVFVVVCSLALLLLPTKYTLIVHTSRYFGYCDVFNESSPQACKTLDPPRVIEKREPFVVSWWNKVQIQRQFKTSEASVQ
jgi:hypothetical protein